MHIKLYADEDYLIVENNLQRKMTGNDDSSKLGLDNIRKRYEYLSDRKVNVEENESKFVVHIPCLTEIK